MIPSTTGESHPSKYIVGDTGKLGLCVKNVVENEKISPLSVNFHSILFTVIDTDTVTLQPLQGYCEKKWGFEPGTLCHGVICTTN